MRLRRGGLRLGLLGLLVGSMMVTLLVGSAAAADPAAGCTTTAGTTTCVFAYTGARQEWVVPAGVTSAVFDLDGAAGGSFAPIGDLPGGTGGQGGHVNATVAVTPGATLYLRVGGKGEDGFASPNPFDGTLTAAGGFNGGGTTTITCSGCAFTLGGAGGGGSDVRTSADGLANRLLVAGGGGGAGVGGVRFPDGSMTGDGGDSATDAPSVSSNFDLPFDITCSGGGAGTLIGPGAAGSGLGCVSGSPGDPAGGAGGGVTQLAQIGAGGGGLWGGGAGAGGQVAGSGGGGGSNLVGGGTATNGVRAGNGLITISYTTPVNDQLSTLLTAVTGVGPGKSLANKVKQVQAYVAANDTPAACSTLNGFINLVMAQTGKKLTAGQAASFIAQATAIKSALGC